MYVDVPRKPTRAHIAQQNTINYVHFLSLPDLALTTCPESVGVLNVMQSTHSIFEMDW